MNAVTHTTSLEELLSAGGFVPIDGQSGLWEWREGAAPTTQTLSVPGAEAPRSIWTCKRWIIRKSGETWSTVSLRFHITRDSLRQWLQETILQSIGGAALAEVAVGVRQDQWLLVEFMRPRSKHLMPLSVTSHSPAFHSPYGVAGLRMTVGLEKGDLLLQTADPFAIGYVPARFFFQVQELLTGAAGGRWRDVKADANLFETRIGLTDILVGMLSVKMGEEWAAQLFAAAADAVNRFKDMGVATARVTPDGWDLTLEEEGREAAPFHPPVIEVLEARELGANYKQIDKMIFNGDWDAASQAMKEAWEAKGPSLFILRRMALLHLSGRFAVDQKALDEGLNAEPANKLFLSATIKRAAAHAQKHSEELLAAVSRLGELIYGSIIDAEQLRALEVVLPEFLGDCWFMKDAKMAQTCYERVINKRGDQPRLLTKMAILTHSQGLPAQEILVLRRLVAVERRKPELAAIYLRLAQLHQGLDPDAVVRNAIQSLSYAHDNLEAVNLVCDTLIQGGRPTEVIQVLTETLTRLESVKDNRRKAELEIAIGEIWETYLGRKDLARERYARALALADTEPVLRRLVNIFSTLDDKVHLAQSMREIISIDLESGGDVDREAVEQLAQLYLDQLQEPKQALQLYRDLNRAGVLTAMELAQLIAWPQFEGEWEEFYRELVARPVAGERGERIEWETLLGDFARRKLDSDEGGVTHYLAALKAGGLDEQNFTFLHKKLRDEGRHAELVEALRYRLGHVPEDHRWRILNEIVQYPKHLDDDESDSYAFLLMSAPEPATDFFRARLDHYRDTRDPFALARLAAQVKNLGDRSKVAPLLDEVLERLEDMPHPRKFEACAQVLEALKAEQGETPAFLERAVKMLQGAPEKSLPRGYLMRLVELRRKPQLPMGAVLELLRDSAYHQAIYYGVLLEHLDPDGAESAPLAREAWKVLRVMNGMDAEKVAALAIMSRHGLLSREEMAQFKEICTRLGRWSDLKEGAERQLGYSSDKRDTAALLHSLIEIAWFHEGNLDAALALYQRLVLVAEDPLKAWLELAEFAVRNAAEAQAIPHVASVWQQPDLHRHPECVKQAMDWFNRLRLTKAQVAEMALPVVEQMFASGGGKPALDVARTLLEKGVVSPRTASACLQDAFHGNGEDQAVHVFHAALSALRDAAALSEFMSASLKAFTLAERRPLFEELLLAGLADEFPVILPGPTEIEIKFFLAQLFYDENRRLDVALRLFHDLFADNPEDTRVWGPYYHLLKQANERDQILKFLAQVIPVIKSGEVALDGLSLDLAEVEREWLALLGEGGAPLEQEGAPKPAIPLPDVTAIDNVVALPTRFRNPDNEPQSMNVQKAVGERLAPEEPERNAGNRARLRVVTGDEETAVVPQPFLATQNDSSEQSYPTDWRRFVQQMKPYSGFTQVIFDKAFPSEREKHVALQAVAVVSGEAEPLMQWQHNVWRDFQKLPYPLDFKTRATNEEMDPALASDLARLVAVMTPALIHFYRERFSIVALARRFRQPPERIMQARKIVPWEDEFFVRIGLHHYAREFAAGRVRAAALPGIGAEIFYDANERVLYFDPRHYQKLPPSHLRYRMLWATRAIRLNFYFILALDPIEQLVPFLAAARNSLERKGWDAIKVAIGLARDPVGPALQKVERSRLRAFFKKVERLSKRDLVALVDAMNLHIYRINFAETLDLVGIAEEVLDADIFRGSNRDWPVRVQRSEVLKGLLLTATRLRLE